MKSDLLFEERQIQNIIKESNARIVTVNRQFFVIEKSGRKEEIELLYRELNAFGIINTLSLRDQLDQLGKCRFMDASEFEEGVDALKDKKIVIPIKMQVLMALLLELMTI